MTPESPKSLTNSSATNSANTSQRASPDSDPLRDDDALWSILGNTTESQPDPFFARNTVRAARQLEDTPSTWLERITSFFTPPRAIASLAAAACVGLLIVTQLDQPDSQTNTVANNAPNPPSTDATTAGTTTPPSSTDALEALVIEESLLAAAEDPSQFTHDELVAIVGL